MRFWHSNLYVCNGNISYNSFFMDDRNGGYPLMFSWTKDVLYIIYFAFATIWHIVLENLKMVQFGEIRLVSLKAKAKVFIRKNSNEAASYQDTYRVAKKLYWYSLIMHMHTTYICCFTVFSSFRSLWGSWFKHSHTGTGVRVEKKLDLECT